MGSPTSRSITSENSGNGKRILKGQWYIIAAVLFSYSLMSFFYIFNSYSQLDYTTILKNDEDVTFYNVLQNLGNISNVSSSETFTDDVSDYMSMVEGNTVGKGILVDYNISRLRGNLIIRSLKVSSENVKAVIEGSVNCTDDCGVVSSRCSDSLNISCGLFDSDICFDQTVDNCSDCSCYCADYKLSNETGYCSDGKDNDCDGLADGNDPDCFAPVFECTPGTCNTTSRRYCNSTGFWTGSDSSEYCSNCAHCTDNFLNCAETWIDCGGGGCSPCIVGAGGYRRQINITNTGSAITNYALRIAVPYNSHMQNDFDDIRFMQSDGTTKMSYWRESYTSASSAVFWVKIPLIPSGSSAIYMYYGNSTVASESNGTATFEFYEDFNDGVISDWSVQSSCRMGGGGAGIDTRYIHSPPYSLQNYISVTCMGGISASSSHQFSVPDSATYRIDFYARKSSCGSFCTVSAVLRVDGHNLLDHGVTGTMTQINVTSSLSAGNHQITVGLYRDHHSSSAVSANFDDIHIGKYASPAPTYSFGSEEQL